MGALVVLVVVTVLVVDPAQTVSRDLGSLYAELGPGGWTGVVIALFVWLVVVVSLTVGALVVSHLTWVQRDRLGPPAAWTARVGTAATALGLVAAISPIVPGFPMGLMFFTIAEDLGTAPPSGSMSDLLLAISWFGVGCLLLAVVAVVAFAVLAHRATRLRREPLVP